VPTYLGAYPYLPTQALTQAHTVSQTDSGTRARRETCMHARAYPLPPGHTAKRLPPKG
jgi:hypothetical protein